MSEGKSGVLIEKMTASSHEFSSMNNSDVEIISMPNSTTSSQMTGKSDKPVGAIQNFEKVGLEAVKETDETNSQRGKN